MSRVTLRNKIEARIEERRGECVFVPREFSDLGGDDQILRSLRHMVRDGVLVKIGYGLSFVPANH